MEIIKWHSGATIDNTTLTAYAPSANSSWIPIVLSAQDTSGKRYFEVQHLTGLYIKTGICNAAYSNYWHLDDNRGGSASSPVCTKVSIPAYAGLARIMVAYDLDEGKIWLGVNGTWFANGNPANNLNPSMSGITVFGSANPVFPYIEIIGGSSLISARFYPYAEDWLYAPAGFSEATAFTLGGRVTSGLLRRDIENGGDFRIAGTVDELGAVGTYRVRLFDRQSARVIRETWSAADGSYAFDWIAYKDKGYFAIAYDHGDNPVNAAIADLLTPEPMPT